MKIFALRNENDQNNKDIAYLIYYEKAKKFYIELPSSTDQWDVPIVLSSFVKDGETTVNSYWSRVWVQQRIVPSDRQNLGQILRDNDLKDYDEYELLKLSEGRCAQDDFYLVSIPEGELPEEIQLRNRYKIEYAIPLEQYRAILFFRDGTTKICDLDFIFDEVVPKIKRYKEYSAFRSMKIMAGGYGLTWGDLIVLDKPLYERGKDIQLSIEDFKLMVDNGTVNSAEAADILDCSRQNIDDLIKRDKLHPIKTNDRNKLFLRDEIMKREWE